MRDFLSFLVTKVLATRSGPISPLNSLYGTSRGGRLQRKALYGMFVSLRKGQGTLSMTYEHITALVPRLFRLVSLGHLAITRTLQWLGLFALILTQFHYIAYI